MPKLHHRLSDGWYYIRTYAHAGDDGHNGTWQIHAAGMDVLRQERIVHDDADIPVRLFRYLRNARLIYTETGELRLPPRQPPERSSSPSTSRRRQPKPPTPEFRFAPIIRFVFNDDGTWYITAGLDHLGQPYWTEQSDPLRQLIRDTANGRICIGDATLPANCLDADDPFSGCVTPVVLQDEPYVARLRGKRPNGSNLSVQIGHSRGICATGTLFTFHGRRLGRNEPAEWGESYYIVLKTLYADPNLLLDACQPLRLHRRVPWSAYRIRLPNTPDPAVCAYLAQIGHAIPDTQEMSE